VPCPHPRSQPAAARPAAAPDAATTGDATPARARRGVTGAWRAAALACAALQAQGLRMRLARANARTFPGACSIRWDTPHTMLLTQAQSHHGCSQRPTARHAGKLRAAPRLAA